MIKHMVRVSLSQWMDPYMKELGNSINSMEYIIFIYKVWEGRMEEWIKI